MPATNPKLYRLDRDLTTEQLLAELAATPDRLRDVVEQCTGELAQPGAADAWSPIEVIRHVRDIVQVYGMRFKWMMLQDDPLLPDYDENRWVAGSPDGAADIEDVLTEIYAYRGETLRLLRSLGPEGWLRRGRHEVLGVVQLESYVRHQLAHEQQHLEQLQGAFGAMSDVRSQL